MKYLVAAVITSAVVLGLGAAQAATNTWDGDDSGGDQIWSEPDTNSWSGATNNVGDDVKFLGAGLSTVTIDAGGVTPGDITVNSGANYTFSGDIGGSGTLTKAGVGNLTLDGANTFNGGIVLDGGIIKFNDDGDLGTAGAGITVTATAGLSWLSSVNIGTRPISIASGAVLGLYNNDINHSIYTVGGPVTGGGGLLWTGEPGTSGGANNQSMLLTSTANTFTGPLTIGGANDSSFATTVFEFNSIGDSTNAITLDWSSAIVDLRYGSGATADLVLNQRPLVLDNNNYNLRNSSSYHMYLNGPVRVGAGTDGAQLRVVGGAGTIGGDLANDGGKVMSVYQGGGTWNLAGTNTYSGTTSIASGTLGIKGPDAMSPNTKIYMQKYAGLKLMMDDAGTVNLGNEVEVNANDTSSTITTSYTITVDNNGGATTGSTIALGKLDFQGGGGNFASARIMEAAGANGYRLQFGDVDMNIHGVYSSGYQNQGLAARTAPITITGTVKQLNGNTGNTTANYLYLGGALTTATNHVTGLIKDPDDYPGNALAQPLTVRLNTTDNRLGTQDSLWSFDNTNSYSGGTIMWRGKLYANATNALGFGDVTVAGTAADLVINVNDAMDGSAKLTLPNNSTETLIMNADMTVGALTLGATPQANGEYTSSEAWMGGSGTLTVGAPGTGPVYWDIDGSTAGSGPDDTPDGTWDGANTYWNNAAGDGAAAAWSPSNTAVFAAGSDATGAYTVTVDGTREISGLQVEEGSVTITNGTALRLVGDAVVSIAPGSTCTVATAISEDGSARAVSKSSDGKLVLSGANSYSGPTTIAAGSLEAAAADALSGTDVSILNGAKLKVTAAGGVDGGDISVANGAWLHLTDANAVADADGVTIESTGATWTRDTDINISNLTFNTAGNPHDNPPAYTIGGNALNFISGGTIDAPVSSYGTITFSCSITGSPEVRIGSGDAGSPRYFQPGAGLTQTLGAIVHPYGTGWGDKGALYLGGTTTGNTAESVTWEGPGNMHYGRLYKEGTGKWTINGDVDQGNVYVNEGTLIINGACRSKYSGLTSVASGARLGGNCTIEQHTASGYIMGNLTVNGGGILSPGDGGVGKITLEWGASDGARTFKMSDNSIYEYDVGVGTNDLIDVSGDVGDGQTETLDLDNFTLVIQDGGGSPLAGAQLPVFTYDSAVTVNMGGFSNVVSNFDTSDLDNSWFIGTLQLTDDTSGTIYLTGLSKAPPGSILIVR